MIKIKQLGKSVKLRDTSKQILDKIYLEIKEGEFVAIMGPSGSGKSTLLNIIGGLDDYQTGEYFFKDKIINDNNNRLKLRRNEVGIVVQNFALIPELSCKDNILIGKNDKNNTSEIMKNLGIFNIANSKIRVCSGGEKQRTAIARAIIKNPKLLLADEPTGALDSENGIKIMELLRKLNNDGLTIILATHDLSLAQYAQRIIMIKDGKIEENQ